MCTLFANLFMLSTWGPHMVYMGSPYIFYIYMIKYGWLGRSDILCGDVRCGNAQRTWCLQAA